MKVFSIVLLRLLLLFKWFFQSLGIFISFSILSSRTDLEFIAVASAILIILPELIMGSILWIFRGIRSVYEEENVKYIYIIGKNSLIFSSFHYIASFSCLGLDLGLFIGIPIIIFGISLVFCLFFLEEIKNLTKRYLQIY